MQWVLKRNIILSIVGGLVIALWIALHSLAANVDYSVDTVYDVPKDGASTVTHLVSANNSSNETPPKTIQVPVVGSEITAVTATGSNRADLQATYDEGSQLITVPIPAGLAGSNKEWSFTLSYESDLMRSFGETQVIQIPKLELPDISLAEQTARITADLDLGFATTRGPEPTTTDISVGKQVVSYSNEAGPLNESITLLFGETAVADVSVNATLSNSSFWWKTVRFALPPDTNQQQVLIQSIEPEPSAVKLDPDGNVVVEYNLGPKQDVSVVASALVQVNSLAYNTDSSQTINDIDQQLKDRYTAATENWQPQNFDIQVGDSPVVDIVRQIQDAVIQTVTDDISSSPLNVPSRSQGLKYADMLVGELRSSGIPARVVLGKVFSDGNELLSEPINHAWAEAYVPGIGWMTLDPAFSTHADYFGATDVTHVGLVLWGINDDRPPVSLEATNVSFGESEFSVPEEQPHITARKYIIFPGISVLSTSVQTPAGAIVDNTAVKTVSDGAIIPLGSLAPLQTAQNRTLRMGGSAFSSETIEYGLLSGDELLASASQESSLSYLIVFYEIAVIIIALFIVGVIRLRRNRLNRTARSREAVQMHEEAEGENIEEENLIHTPPPDQQSDTFPEPVDPGETSVEESVLPPEPTPPPEEKDDTIEPPKNDNNHRPKPPHSHLVQ